MAYPIFTAEVACTRSGTVITLSDTAASGNQTFAESTTASGIDLSDGDEVEISIYDSSAGAYALWRATYDDTAGTLTQVTERQVAGTIGTAGLLVAAILPGDHFDLGTYTEPGSTLTASGGTLTIPLDGGIYGNTVTGDITLAATAPTAPLCGSATLYLTMDGIGSHTVSFPGTWLSPDGTLPTVDTAASSVTELVIRSTPGGSVVVSGGPIS